MPPRVVLCHFEPHRPSSESPFAGLGESVFTLVIGSAHVVMQVHSLDDTLSVTTNFFPACRKEVLKKPYFQWFAKQVHMQQQMPSVNLP